MKQFSPTAVIYLFSGFISLVICILVSNSTDARRRNLFWPAAIGFIWQFTFFAQLTSSSEIEAYLYYQLTNCCAIPFIAPSVFYFIKSWTEDYSSREHGFCYVIYIAVLFAGIGAIFPQEIAEINNVNGLGYMDFFRMSAASNLYAISLLTFILIIGIKTFAALLSFYKKALIKRIYIQFLITLVIGYCSSIDFLVAFKLSNWLYGGPIFSLFISICFYLSSNQIKASQKQIGKLYH